MRVHRSASPGLKNFARIGHAAIIASLSPRCTHHGCRTDGVAMRLVKELSVAGGFTETPRPALRVAAAAAARRESACSSTTWTPSRLLLLQPTSLLNVTAHHHSILLVPRPSTVGTDNSAPTPAQACRSEARDVCYTRLTWSSQRTGVIRSNPLHLYRRCRCSLATQKKKNSFDLHQHHTILHKPRPTSQHETSADNHITA